MPRRISEEAPRKPMIDPPLEQAGSYLRDHYEELRLRTLLPSVLDRAFKGEL
jgi:hypothetical protein